MSAPISEILDQRYSRRSVLKTGFAAAVMASVSMPRLAMANVVGSRSSLLFDNVPRGVDSHHHVAGGYDVQILMRWGDPVVAGAPAFNPLQPSPDAQAKQFGFNNDFISYFPIRGASNHGLLCVNHEYTAPELMFAGGRLADDLTAIEHLSEMQAHGCSIVEMRRDASGWKMVESRLNRRITATTPMRMSGPAAGHPRLQTSADPSGMQVLGTFANCAGGQTPWGTYLTCEENIDGYFNRADYDGAEADNHARMTMSDVLYHRWDKVDRRFSIVEEPHEPNRFGWVVEIDPFNPASMPVKRTALGRFKHESATPVISRDGRVVVYTGDDAHFQCIYKFVSTDQYRAGDAAHNRQLLDHGVLYVAQFAADATVRWLPLVQGQGPLTPENGFYAQADVLIETRRAAELLGATPMDRPEDVDVNHATGRVYATMTKNPQRTDADFINRRAPNPMGYVLEMTPPGEGAVRDHTAMVFEWELFLEGGDPHETDYLKGHYAHAVDADGWLACPDNLAFDPKGRIWITTDGQPGAIKAADGVYAADTHGPARGATQCFFRAPVGAEVTGPCFTPDGSTLFLSVQHPAEGSGFDSPSTRWPDFNDTMPARSAIVAITKQDGGVIGG